MLPRAFLYFWLGKNASALLDFFIVTNITVAILVLLAVLMIMNAGAVLLRKKFERRW